MTGPGSPDRRRTGRRCPVRRGDAGITLLEVAVGMSLMSVAMVVFTTGIIALYRSANHNDALVVAQSQVHIAFQRLDAEVRYATSISAEGKAPGTGDWYVEYLSTYTGSPVCTQLRLSAGTLQHRRWAEGAKPPGFTTLASGVTAAHPFTRKAAGIDGYSFERLLVSVSATGGRDARARQVDVAFTALNSSAGTADETTCGEGRPT